MALQSLGTENIEDEGSADDPRTMDIVGKINHVNVDIDQNSVSHFYDSVAQEVNNCLENTVDEPTGEAEVEFQSFETHEPHLDEINDVNVDMDENAVSHFYESLAQEVNNSIENTNVEPLGEAEVEFECLETQNPHLGEVNDVNVDEDENFVSRFYEFLDQEVSKDIENSEDNTRGVTEVEFESFVEQEPHLVKTNDVNEDIDENSVSLFHEPFDPEVRNDIENPEDNRPREAEVEFESCEEQEPHLGKISGVNDDIDETSVSSGKANEIENKSFKEQEPHQEEKSKELKFFLCKMCPSGFKTKGLMERHTNFHLTKKTYACDTCGKDFKTKQSLIKHLTVHEKTKKFKCDVCELTLRHKYRLDIHLRLHGRGKLRKTEKKFLCEVCGKSFTYKGSLKQHEKLHTDVKHKCRFCDKTFSTEGYRSKHELRHGEKRFKCHLCSSIYASDNGLKLHILKHTGEANYPCDICGQLFRRRRNLNEHINTHTGKKPYICPMCGVAYGNAGSLLVHKKKCKLSFNGEFSVAGD